MGLVVCNSFPVACRTARAANVRHLSLILLATYHIDCNASALARWHPHQLAVTRRRVPWSILQYWREFLCLMTLHLAITSCCRWIVDFLYFGSSHIAMNVTRNRKLAHFACPIFTKILQSDVLGPVYLVCHAVLGEFRPPPLCRTVSQNFDPPDNTQTLFRQSIQMVN